VTRGPQQQRLRDYLDRANQGELRAASFKWIEGQDILRVVSQQLERMSGAMGSSGDAEFQGATADAARMSFVVSAQAMVHKADQLKQGADAFDQSATALETAIAERDALAQGDGAQPPVRPTTPPGSTDPEDVRAQRDFNTANAAYWEKYHADEKRAGDAITALDQSHTAAAEVFKSIHGEPDPVPPGSGGSGGAGGGAATPSAGGGGAGGGGDADFDLVATGGGHGGDDDDSDDGGGGDTTPSDDIPDATGTGDGGVHGEITGPTAPTGTTAPTAAGIGSGTPSTAGSGGVNAPAAGGGVAAGLGVGVAGGLAGGVAGGLAFPGTVAGTGGAASGGRGIGAGGPRGAGSPVLGRGNGIAGVGNGAGTGTRGTARGAGRAGAAGSAAGRGTARGRGAAGSRGMLGGSGAGAGRGAGRGKDKRVRGEEHELFDDGQDWLDDEGAYDGVID
jgi:hypothetical protein